MSWAQRRKATYIFSILLVLLVVLAIILYFLFSKTPTCSDGIQNQGERGIDCGGPCAMLCRAEFSNPVVVWGPRWQEVFSNGYYSFLTYVQNPNAGVGAHNVPYNFSVYDEKNVLLYEKTGLTDIPANNNFVIFDDGINLNDKVPARAELKFLAVPVWQKMTSTESSIVTVSKSLTGEDTKPKLSVTLKNATYKPIESIESVAILYDQNDNAVAFSKTKTDLINPNSTADIVFTWPEKFSQQIVKIDVISKVLPQ